MFQNMGRVGYAFGRCRPQHLTYALECLGAGHFWHHDIHKDHFHSIVLKVFDGFLTGGDRLAWNPPQGKQSGQYFGILLQIIHNKCSGWSVFPPGLGQGQKILYFFWMPGGNTDGKTEKTSLSHRRITGKISTQHIHQPLCNSQSQPDSLMFTTSFLTPLLKGLKHSLTILGQHAGPRILN